MMHDLSRVLWSQGLFLQPQHFQHLERVQRTESRVQFDAFASHAWGLSEYEIDEVALKRSCFALRRCQGRFPDGAVFSTVHGTPLPLPLEITPALEGKKVYLAIPLEQSGEENHAREPEQYASRRQRVMVADLRDDIEPRMESAPVEVALPNLKLIAGEAAVSGHAVIPLAVIDTLAKDGTVQLAGNFVPSVLRGTASGFLPDICRDIHSRMQVRSKAMSGRSVASGRLASTEHFLEATMLMAMNRYLPVFEELGRSCPLHPYQAYLLCAQAAGELATYSSVTSVAPSFPGYRHEDQYGSFAPVLSSLMASLSQLIVDSAVQVPIVYVRANYYGAKFTDRTFVAPGNTYVLAVNADLHPDDLRARFPSVAKIAPATRIQELVRSLVPGVPMRNLSTPPPEIRFPSSRTVFFELDAHSPYWEEMTGGITLHLADEFPSIRMELWIIRDLEGAGARLRLR